MRIASIRFATHTRAWLLIAALTALLIGVGAPLGGALRYLLAGLTVAMNVIGYWVSDRFALRAGRAEPVEPGTMPELERGSQALPVTVNAATASLYAVNPLARQGVATLFATHPPMAERVCRLRAVDDDQALGLAA
jgi:Zn-dependent protease with chaperone function